MAVGRVTETDARDPRASRFASSATLAAWLYLAIAVAFVLVTTGHVLTRHFILPYWDQWLWVKVWYDQGLGTMLGAQSNEHRVVIPALLFHVDQVLFAGQGRFLTVAMLSFQLGVVMALALPLYREPRVPRPAVLVFTGFALILMFWMIHGENFFWPISVHTPLANFAAVLAILALTRHLDGRRALAWLAASAALALVAAFSFGHGVLVWPILVLLALAARRWATALGLLAGTAAVLTAYLWTYQSPPHHAQPLESLQAPGRLLRYVTLYVGNPLFAIGATAQDSKGGIGLELVTVAALGLACLAIVRQLMGLRHSRVFAPTAFIGVLLFVLGSAFITALGRINVDLRQATASRYAAVSIMFWLALAGLATLEVCRRERQGGMGRPLWCVALVAASFFVLPSHVSLGKQWEAKASTVEIASLSILTGAFDPEQLATVSWDPEIPIVVADRLRADERSIFALREARLVGSPLQKHYVKVKGDACIGAVEIATLLPRGGARVSGWAWDARSKRRPSRIVMADDDGVIRGIGLIGLPRPDVVSATGRHRLSRSGWIAYSSPASDGRQLTTYVILDDGRSACPLHGSPAR